MGVTQETWGKLHFTITKKYNDWAWELQYNHNYKFEARELQNVNMGILHINISKKIVTKHGNYTVNQGNNTVWWRSLHEIQYNDPVTTL